MGELHPGGRRLALGSDQRIAQMDRYQGFGDLARNDRPATRKHEISANITHIACQRVLAKRDPRFVWVNDKIVFRANRPTGAEGSSQ